MIGHQEGLGYLVVLGVVLVVAVDLIVAIDFVVAVDWGRNGKQKFAGHFFNYFQIVALQKILLKLF